MQFTSMTEYIKGSSHNATTIYDNTRLGRIVFFFIFLTMILNQIILFFQYKWWRVCLSSQSKSCLIGILSRPNAIDGIEQVDVRSIVTAINSAMEIQLMESWWMHSSQLHFRTRFGSGELWIVCGY